MTTSGPDPTPPGYSKRRPFGKKPKNKKGPAFAIPFAGKVELNNEGSNSMTENSDVENNRSSAAPSKRFQEVNDTFSLGVGSLVVMQEMQMEGSQDLGDFKPVLTKEEKARKRQIRKEISRRLEKEEKERAENVRREKLAKEKAMFAKQAKRANDARRLEMERAIKDFAVESKTTAPASVNTVDKGRDKAGRCRKRIEGGTEELRVEEPSIPVDSSCDNATIPVRPPNLSPNPVLGAPHHPTPPTDESELKERAHSTSCSSFDTAKGIKVDTGSFPAREMKWKVKSIDTSASTCKMFEENVEKNGLRGITTKLSPPAEAPLPVKASSGRPAYVQANIGKEVSEAEVQVVLQDKLSLVSAALQRCTSAVATQTDLVPTEALLKAIELVKAGGEISPQTVHHQKPKLLRPRHLDTVAGFGRNTGNEESGRIWEGNLPIQNRSNYSHRYGNTAPPHHVHHSHHQRHPHHGHLHHQHGHHQHGPPPRLSGELPAYFPENINHQSSGFSTVFGVQHGQGHYGGAGQEFQHMYFPSIHRE